VCFFVVGCLGVYTLKIVGVGKDTDEDHCSLRNERAVPMEVLDCFAGKRHAAYGIKAYAFFNDRIDVFHFLLHKAVLPSGIAVSIVCFHDGFVSRLLYLLAFFGG